MKGKPSILTVGDINLDIIAPIPFYPQKGGEGVTNRAEIHLGGSATNTAVLLARSGFKTYLLGRIGEDPFGDYALRLLSHTGIDMSLIQRDQNLTTGIMFIVVTPDGERTIFGQRGANVNLEPISLNGTQFANLSWVHVSGYSFLQEPQRSTAMKILEEASALGISTSLDVGICAAFQAREEIEKALNYVKVLFLSAEEARALTGQENPGSAIEYALTRGVRKVAVKLGDEGCLVSDGKNVHKIPALPVEVVDTTGAGDAFNAGFILGELSGRSIEESGKIGNLFGALACTVIGAGERLPVPDKTTQAFPFSPNLVNR
jgi:ribokinase